MFNAPTFKFKVTIKSSILLILPGSLDLVCMYVYLWKFGADDQETYQYQRSNNTNLYLGPHSVKLMWTDSEECFGSVEVCVDSLASGVPLMGFNNTKVEASYAGRATEEN